MNYYNEITPKYLYCLNYLTNHYYKVKIELLADNEVPIGEIERDVSTSAQGQININYQQLVRRSVSLTLMNVDGKYIPNPNNPFWLDRKFKLWLGLNDYQDTYWFSQGVYITRGVSATNHDITIEGIDKGGVLSGDLRTNMLSSDYLIEAGAPISRFVRDTLLQSEDRFIIDSVAPIINPQYDSAIIQSDITLNKHEYLGTLMVNLANSYGADAFYDSEGRLNFVPVIADYRQVGSQFAFSDINAHYIQPTTKYSYDIVNCVTVFSNYKNDTTQNVSYTAYNRNYQSPININAVKIRKMEAQELKYANVFPEEMLKRCRDYANHLLMTNSLIGMTEDFGTCIIPHIDVNVPITITNKQQGLKDEVFVVQSVSIPLSADDMSINATRLSYLPISTNIEKVG